MSNDLFSSDGYRLDVFQLYNWGVFNESIFTLDCKKESSLLTGTNGSGKTTIVDAIISLLVPYQNRSYNQSSGTDKKRDRTEETYVLGAYGNKQDEDSASAKKQTLRNKDAISILNGCFTNDSLQTTYSLLQIRYFSGDILQHLYAITKQRLTIEQINETLAKQDMALDRNGKWKRIITDTFGTIFYGDNFKLYKNTFSQLFGFRSDKALRLFSQTVGLKVLGDLTDFIRANMLEESGADTQFEKLQSNYTKLINSYNIIQKTKKQIELLEPILELGEKRKAELTERTRLKNLVQVIPAWYSSTAVNLLEEQQKELQNNKEETEEHQKNEVSKRETLEKEITSLEIALNKDDEYQHINKLNNDIENLTKDKARIQSNRDLYKNKIDIVSLPLPQSEAGFFQNKKKIDSLVNKENDSKQNLEAKKFEIKTSQNELYEQKNSITKELASLGNRNSNIPLANIELRSTLSKAVHCEENELPFAGELLCVAESEQQWNYGIEKLLHNFALDILVPEKLYKKVTEYVKNNNLHGRIVYLKTEENLSLENLKSLPVKSVPGKLLIKQNHILTTWITQYVNDNFNYLCTDDVTEFTKAERALSSSGLIKNKIRHEKDDRKNIQNSFVQVLGWDNTQKRKNLSSQLDEVENQLKQNISSLEKTELQYCESENRIRTLENITEYNSWSEIDTESCAKQIDKLQHEVKLLESKATGLRDLQKQLDDKKIEKSNVNEQISKINEVLGVVKSKLEEIENKLQSNKSTLETLLKDDLISKNIEIELENLHKEYIRLSEPKTISELEANKERISGELNSKANGCSQRMNGFDTQLIQKMNEIKSPSPTLRSHYGDWSNEFNNFGNTFDSLNDYIDFYNRLKKDDLPRYSKQFQEYLHDTMKNDIVDFNQFIQDAKQEIQEAISNLNSSLKSITYSTNPDTFLQLEYKDRNDIRIKDFKTMLRNAIPDSLYLSQHDEEKEEQLFNQIKILIDKLQSNDYDKKYVLDIRNWFDFAAKELYRTDSSQKKYYENTASLSGGEKAKLTYTILASSIAYQFGIQKENSSTSSFRFVLIDEAFSKSDSFNSEYAMKLFDQLDLQLMVITPLDKINIVEKYISTVHITESTKENSSIILHMSIEDYEKNKKEFNSEVEQ